jgi:hypothetical protein
VTGCLTLRCKKLTDDGLKHIANIEHDLRIESDDGIKGLGIQYMTKLRYNLNILNCYDLSPDVIKYMGNIQKGIMLGRLEGHYSCDLKNL